MRYVSTRGGGSAATFSGILLGGLMEDGGLAVPAAYPQVTGDDLTAWRKLDYRGLALEILRRYADDMPVHDLRRIVDLTYTAAAFSRTRLRRCGNCSRAYTCSACRTA